MHLSNLERRRRDRKMWRTAFLASVLFHILIFLVGPQVSIPESPFAAAGPRAMDDEAAQGSMQMLSLSSAPPDAAIPPPAPIPDIEEPPIEEIEIEPDAAPEIELEEIEIPLPGVGQSAGDDVADDGDAGLPEATGQGDGGTTDEGLFRLVAPVPRATFIPPTPPSNLRDVEVEIWLFVNDEGRVVPDSTRLDPPTSNRRYNDELKASANQWVFRPAQQGEESVASWWSYRVGR